MRRSSLFLLALLLAPSVASAEGVAVCPDFRSGWGSAASKLGLTRGVLSFGAPDGNGAETVSGLAGVQGKVICREGVLGRIELRPSGDVAALEKAAASVIMGLDKATTPEQARDAVAALRAEAASGSRGAASSWGPYDLSWGPSAEVGQDEFVLDLAEN